MDARAADRGIALRDLRLVGARVPNFGIQLRRIGNVISERAARHRFEVAGRVGVGDAEQDDEAVTNATIQTLTSERAKVAAEYQEKLGIYQPDYPLMAQMRARIEAGVRPDGILVPQRAVITNSVGSYDTMPE